MKVYEIRNSKIFDVNKKVICILQTEVDRRTPKAKRFFCKNKKQKLS